jgi:hypothetical protein
MKLNYDCGGVAKTVSGNALDRVVDGTRSRWVCCCRWTTIGQKLTSRANCRLNERPVSAVLEDIARDGSLL